MGNFNATKAEVRNCLIARVPLIILRSSERERTERMLRQLCAELRTEMYYYTDVKQVVNLMSGASLDVDRDPLKFAQSCFRKKRGSTFVLGDARKVGDENAFSRELLDTLYLARENSGTVILVTPDYVWNRLAQFGMMVVLDYPDAAERRALLTRFCDTYGTRYRITRNADSLDRAAMLLRGFSEVQIDNILSSALVAGGKLEEEELKDLSAQKSRLYAAVPCVEEVSLPDDLTVSGLENLRAWLKQRGRLFFEPDEVLHSCGLTTPKGILLSGIPGCGKSLSAKMVAQEWNLPLFRFDIGSVYEKWVGESEHKMTAALTFIDNVAPCVVWIDEIEKALSVSDSGNDTGKRVLGQFLYWLQESRARVFLVATANDITALPPELFRKGRFSEIFFIDLPDAGERAAAIAQYMEKCLHRLPSPALAEELTAISEGYSYSDIEYVIKEAAQRNLLSPGTPVTDAELTALFRSSIPYASTNPENVETLREWGRQRAVPASGNGIRKEESE